MKVRPSGAALLLAWTSGAAGLAHQILWTRRLLDLLGANADTFSKVVGAFFVGLALGAWASARTAPGARDFWRRVALAELGVALLAVPVLFSVQITDWAEAALAHGRGLQLALPLVLVTPPAIAMGLVVPWMIRALAGNPSFHSSQSVWLYAVNTAGGIAGIALVVFEALPRFGLNGAGLGAIALNLLVAIGAYALHFHERRSHHFSAGLASDSRWLAPADNAPKQGNAVAFLAFLSGFLTLALEVILQHQVAQVTINSLFSSALVLVLVLLALTAAAALAPWCVRLAGDAPRALNGGLLAAALLCAAQPFLFTGLRDGLALLPYEWPPLRYLAAVVQLGVLAVCPMLVAGGLIFPLLLRDIVARKGEVGRLFAWNGLGGWLGAEMGQGWIAPAFGLWGSVACIAAIYGAAFVWRILASRGGSKRSRGLRLVACSLSALTVGVCLWFSRALPQAGLAPAERLAALAVGREGVVATVESGPGDWRMLFNNSYTLGGSKAQFNQERQGMLPLLLHGRPQSVATLGVATGGTVAGAALHPDVRQIDAIELSPLVLRYAREFFGPYNRDVFHDPRVRFLQEDARWIIAGRRAAYDVVVGDLFLPWRTGEGRLFSREHFQNVRRSLKPGGLYCQWLPLFQLTRAQFDTITRTFRDVFPDAFVVRGDFYSELPILGLVGGCDLGKVHWALVNEACARVAAENKITDPLLRHVEGVAMMIAGPLPIPSSGPMNTLANAWLEWDAGHNIVGLKEPWFIGVPLAEYVRELHHLGQPLLPPEWRSAHDAGQFFLTLEIAAKLKLPALADLQSQASDRLPFALRADAGADWTQWPMRVKPAFPMRPLP